MDNKPSFVSDIERQRARTDISADFYAQALEASKEFRKEYGERTDIVKSSEMPMERTADGLLKHIFNEGMNTRECCIDTSTASRKVACGLASEAGRTVPPPAHRSNAKNASMSNGGVHGAGDRSDGTFVSCRGRLCRSGSAILEVSGQS